MLLIACPVCACMLCPMKYYSMAVDPPIGGVPLSSEIIGSLIQPGMGPMYNYYHKKTQPFPF